MTQKEEQQSKGLVAIQQPPDGPLVTPNEAKEAWKQYQALELAILTDEDYLWFVEYDEWDDRKRRSVTRRITCKSKADAETKKKAHKDAEIVRRKIKSAARKLAKFFGLEIPQDNIGLVEIRKELVGDYVVQIERGDYYVITQWLDKNLLTVKASATVFLRAPSGRAWMSNGGAHQSEGFSDDFAIVQTALTRAINRCALDLVGFGDQSAEETPLVEPSGSEGSPEPPARPAAAPATSLEEDSLQDVFPPKAAGDEEVERTELWKYVRQELARRTMTPIAVINWLEKRGFVIKDSVAGLASEQAPGLIPTSTLRDLVKAIDMVKTKRSS